MNITTVLLDAGGVILDESESEATKARIIADALQCIVPGYSIADYYADIDEAVASFCPNAYQYVMWKHSRGDVEVFNRLNAVVNDQRSQHPPLKLSAGIHAEVVDISRRFDIGIAGQYGREVLDLLEQESLLDCFRHHYTQDDFSITKPDPRYYEQIAQACGADPKECIMVGDRIDKDIIPAKQVGMLTVLIRTGLHINQQARIPSELPDVELSGVAGLAEAIDGLAGELSI